MILELQIHCQCRFARWAELVAIEEDKHASALQLIRVERMKPYTTLPDQSLKVRQRLAISTGKPDAGGLSTCQISARTIWRNVPGFSCSSRHANARSAPKGNRSARRSSKDDRYAPANYFSDSRQGKIDLGTGGKSIQRLHSPVRKARRKLTSKGTPNALSCSCHQKLYTWQVVLSMRYYFRRGARRLRSTCNHS